MEKKQVTATECLCNKTINPARSKIHRLRFHLLLFTTVLFGLNTMEGIAQDQCTVTEVFDFTGAAQTFNVPANVTLITVNAWGAEGGTVLAGTNPGFGGLGSAVLGSQLAVTPGEILDVFVGGTPNPATHGPGFPDPDPAATTPGGFNGGGDGGSNAGSNTFHGGGGGGGASDVRQGGSDLTDRVVVAGGGGGGSHGGGGGDGGLVGGDGQKTGDDTSTQGTGATDSAGGTGGQGGTLAANTDGQDGSSGQGGAGGVGGDGGGGGGGGWFGGGGGGGGAGTAAGGGAGGGGGSSFSTDNVNTTFESGENEGDGLVEISYQRPGCVTEIQLNEGPCWRMLSSPVDGLTYNQFLGDLWTQGFPGADYDDGVPNVYLWNTNEAGIGQTGWVTPGNLNDVIPPGSGFLISVFTDDEHGTPGTWPKTLDVTGTGDEHVPLTFTNMNTNSDGWTLIGNPFLTPIDFAELNTTDISGVAYIYDRNLTGPFDGVDTNNNTGGWRTTDGTYGDVIDGIISPFQGFFVQNNGTGPSVEFTDNSRSIGGEFYGKQRERNNFVRLEVRGKELYNSMWVRFSNDGSFERTHGDALKLIPLAEEYALLGSRKVDGTLTDIGHFPEPNEEAVIPVSFQTTQPGSYSIIATDLDIPAGVNLYLIDLQTNQSIRIDGEFEYTFSASQASKSTPDQNGIIPCQASPQMAAKTTGDDRFVITTSAYIADSELPVDVSLSQNYPNPFNPTTVIRYELPQQADVRIEVFDMAGRRVATLAEGSVQAGVHTVNFDASHLSSGVYLYTLQTDGVALTRKLTLIK